MWLLIGGSGFIGTNFAHYLLEHDHDFSIYDAHRSPYLPKKTKVILGDIRDKKKLTKALQDCDTVFHLATVPPSVRLSSKEIYDIDVNGTKNVLNLATEYGIKRVIFTSSASHVYGLVDSAQYPLRESCPLNPINDYGKNKVLAEQCCNQMSQTTELETIVLRLSMVLGPYDFDPILQENVRLLLANKPVRIPGNGVSKNQCVHVYDVSTALLASTALKLGRSNRHEMFNIAGNDVLTINEWMKTARAACNSSSKITHVPLPLAKGFMSLSWMLHRTNIHPSYLELMNVDQYFDISKAQEMLEWEPTYTTTDAVHDTISFLETRQNKT